MTGTEWNGCATSRSMLAHLRQAGRLTDRKLTLFAGACCRHVYHLLVDARFAQAIAVAERYADGLASEGDCRAAGAVASGLAGEWGMGPGLLRLDGAARFAALATAWAAMPGEQEDAAGMARKAEIEDAQEKEKANPALSAWAVDVVTNGDMWQANLVREVFGPFGVGEPPQTWLTKNEQKILALAQDAYSDRIMPQGELDPQKLRGIAGALEQAGSVDPEILAHLRLRNARHVRGCWAIDLLTGRR